MEVLRSHYELDQISSSTRFKLRALTLCLPAQHGGQQYDSFETPLMLGEISQLRESVWGEKMMSPTRRRERSRPKGRGFLEVEKTITTEFRKKE